MRAAAQAATDAGALPAAATALADRSLVAMYHQDWNQAATLAEQAEAVVRAGALDGDVASALVHAVAAWVAVHHQGDLPAPNTIWGGPPGCGPCSPAPCPISPSRPCWSWAGPVLALDDHGGAKVVLRQARDILRRRPDLGILPS